VKREYWKYLAVVLPYLKRHKLLAVASLATMAFGAGLALAQPWPFAFIVDSVLGSHPAPPFVTSLVGSSKDDLILFAVAASIGIVLLTSVVGVVDAYVNTRLEQEMALEFRSDLFAHCERLSQAFHDRRSLGDFIYRINFEAHHVGAVTVAIPALIQSAVTIAAMLVITYSISPILAVLSLAVLPFVYLSIGVYGKRVEPRLIRVRNLEGLSLSIVHEVFSRLKVVVAFNRQDHESDRFEQQGRDAVHERVGVTLAQTVFNLGVGLITAIGTGLIIGVGAHLVLEKQLLLGQLIVVMSYIASMYTPLQTISSTIGDFQNHFVALRFAQELMDTEPDVADAPDAIELHGARGVVVMEHVSFDYPTRQGILRDVSFRADPGQVVAIVGPTGAGKSTLVNLLLRYYDPAAGSVTVDGCDVRDVSQRSLRDQIGLVLQEPLLLEGTVAENIRYGKLDATDDEIVAAAEAANAHDFISTLPRGYDTPLGEGGARLSGGERQRICIARAFVKGAPILVLDEPTSSVDSRTEVGILDALDRLMVGRTTFLIAHRLSTVRHADQILVLDRGELVEHGSHDELVARDGVYRSLYDAQVGRPRAPVEPAAASAGSPNGTSVPSEVLDGENVPWSVGGSVRRPRVVLLGMMSKIPVPGVVWQTAHYLAGLERLGFEAYYVEAHARAPSMFAVAPDDDGADAAAAFIARVMRRFGLEHRWAFHALHDGDRCYGMSRTELERLYRSAALVINLHGGTRARPEHAAGGTLIYLETDPVLLQLELAEGREDIEEMLAPHAAFFTFAENLGNPDCKLPVSDRFSFRPTRQPVVLDFWHPDDDVGEQFTTIGNWRQPWRDVSYGDERYSWSKDVEFEKVLDLPGRTRQRFELALGSIDDRDAARLVERGWSVVPVERAVPDLDSYRAYVSASRGEFTVAKDQNVRFRSGWFSDRSATYLASGRPVVTQDTGFGNVLPTGEGLLAFGTVDEAAAAIQDVNASYGAHRRAALEIAHEYFSHDRVLPPLLEHVGLSPARRRYGLLSSEASLPESLVLTPVSKRPLRLEPMTLSTVVDRPVATPHHRGRVHLGPRRAASVIVVTHDCDNVALTRMCLESILANTQVPRFEIVVVDNASGPDTVAYLDALSAAFPRIRRLRNDQNVGFAAAVNQGLLAATAGALVVMNNDVIVTPGWLAGLHSHLDDPGVGLVGPVTNAAPNEARVRATYATYGELLEQAAECRKHLGEPLVDVPVATLFCAAMRRDVFEAVGLLDERFGLGFFEDDDYSLRVRDAGYRVVCADDVFVHHFGEGSFGELAADGEAARLFHENRARFEEKWGVQWTSHSRRDDAGYEDLKRRIRGVASTLALPAHATLVVSNGDDALLDLPGGRARHFPESPPGDYAGHHPGDTHAIVRELDARHGEGARFFVLPVTSAWWLEHYEGLSAHLAAHATELDGAGACRVYALGGVARPGAACLTERGDGKEHA
jgi:ABC-type multidrug transport system fused ATPase/permease subunit/GT2 family glycosyltransferase